MGLVLHAMTLTEAAFVGASALQMERGTAFDWQGTAWTAWKAIESLFAPPRIGGGGYIDPASRVAVAAARALKGHLPSTPPDRLGCVIGSSAGNAWSVALAETTRLRGGRPSPLLLTHAGWNVPAALAAAELEACGPSATLCAGDSTGRELLTVARYALQRSRAHTIAVGAVGVQADGRGRDGGWSIQAACLMGVLSWDRDGDDTGILNEAFLEQFPVEDHLPMEIWSLAAALCELSQEVVAVEP